MQIENLTRLVLNDDELSALYEVCASSLEANILTDLPMAFALAMVEALQEPPEDGIESEEVEQITIN